MNSPLAILGAQNLIGWAAEITGQLLSVFHEVEQMSPGHMLFYLLYIVNEETRKLP